MKEFPNVYVVLDKNDVLAVFYEKNAAILFKDTHNDSYRLRVVGPYKAR